MNPAVSLGVLEFRFECLPGCTACCTQSGDVYLTREDCARAAEYLELEVEEFLRRYCVDDDDGLRLTIPAPDSCHFLVAGGCSIHPVKPLQCRTFPFWPENVRSARAWRGLSKYCPGIGAGPIVPLDEVRRAAAECAAEFPDLEG